MLAGKEKWQANDLATNQIVVLESVKSLDFFDRNEVATQCEISLSTFQNWLGYLPHKDDEVRILKGGKKTYRIDYLEKLFINYGDIEAFKKLKKNTGKPTDKSVDQFEIQKENLETLKNWNLQLASQLTSQQKQNENLQKQNEKLLEIIEKQQTLELERTEQLKLTQNQPPKWITWLLAFFNQNKKN